MPKKPASPVPTTPTHAEMVARLHELYDSEKKVSKKEEEAKGRQETARAKVTEAEEGMTKVDGELQGIERKERRRKEDQAGGDDMEDTVFAEEAGSSEEVGVRVEVGKRRKVAKQRRFFGRGEGGSGSARLDVEEVTRQLHLFSEEERGRSMRPFIVQSDEEVSGLSDENSGGAANRAAPLIGDSVLTPS